MGLRCVREEAEGRDAGGEVRVPEQQVAQTLPFFSPSGAFFVPYFIFFFSCGIPVFFLEVALGQYSSQGSVTAWRKICPLLQGERQPSPFQFLDPPSCPASTVVTALAFVSPLSSPVLRDLSFLGPKA